MELKVKWLRLWVDEILKGTTFDELSLSERGLWFSLLLLAGNSLTPGIVEMRKAVKYPHETLATLVNCDRKTLQKGIKKLISVGKISLLKDGRISITNWSQYQTRYEKYYKNPNSEQEEKPKKNGIDMPGRLEGEVDKKKIKKERKTAFRPNVLLTEKEYDTLRRKYKDEKVKWLLDRLSIWKEAKGTTYKSDYAAINMWVVKAWDKEVGQEQSQQGSKDPLYGSPEWKERYPEG